MKILTICTAAYNAEKYIEKMLNSILASKYKEMLEIIIVNDGSKDRTSAVVAKYVMENPEIVLLIEKENGGAGSARNIAFQAATGKYIKIIDADDWVDTTNFDLFIESIIKNDVDVIWNDYYKFLIKKNHMKRESFVKGKNFGEIHQIDDSCFPKTSLLSMHGITYRTSIIRENNIVLSEGIPYTDFEYVTLPLPYIKTVMCLAIPFYVYQIGIKGQSVSREVTIKMVQTKKYMAEKIYEYYRSKENTISDNCKEIMQMMVGSAFAGYLHAYISQEKFAYRKKVFEIDNCVFSQDVEIWKRISEVSGTVRIARKFHYLGYYPSIVLHKINRIAGGWNNK